MTVPIIDCDAHLIEPADIWTSRVDPKWGDLIPHVVWSDEAESDIWLIGGRNAGPAWAFSAVHNIDRKPPDYPRRLEEVWPAAYDAQARLDLMDEEGIVAQALYPNLAGFGGQAFLGLEDPELKVACVRAYNDFLQDWTSIAPERFIKLCSLPFWDIEASVAEIERVAEMGFHGIVFSGAPHELGMPYLGDMTWDPLFAAAEAAHLPLSFHLGSGDITKSLSPKRVAIEGVAGTNARTSTELFLGVGQQMNDLLFSGVLERHPELQFVMVESGIKWVPFVLEAADYHFDRCGVAQERGSSAMRPSELFQRQCMVTYWFEEDPGATLDLIGDDRVMYETDVPHVTSLVDDDVQGTLAANFGDEDADRRKKVAWENCRRLYALDLDHDEWAARVARTTQGS